MLFHYWQSLLLVPFLVVLGLFSTPSKAIGQCYKNHDPNAHIGDTYQLPRSGASNEWSGEIQQLELGKFTVSFDNQKQLYMKSEKVNTWHAYTYIVIFQYASGLDHWVSLRCGDECKGMANGDIVEVPQNIWIARLVGS
jgi:hypothetical protein